MSDNYGNNTYHENKNYCDIQEGCKLLNALKAKNKKLNLKIIELNSINKTLKGECENCKTSQYLQALLSIKNIASDTELFLTDKNYQILQIVKTALKNNIGG